MTKQTLIKIRNHLINSLNNGVDGVDIVDLKEMQGFLSLILNEVDYKKANETIDKELGKKYSK